MVDWNLYFHCPFAGCVSNVDQPVWLASCQISSWCLPGVSVSWEYVVEYYKEHRVCCASGVSRKKKHGETGGLAALPVAGCRGRWSTRQLDHFGVCLALHSGALFAKAEVVVPRGSMWMPKAQGFPHIGSQLEVGRCLCQWEGHGIL